MKFNINQPLCISELGKRNGQEDSIFPPKDTATTQSKVFIVCDGMGGHEHGEVASGIVADTLGNALSNVGNATIGEAEVHDAINLAYDRLDEAYLKSNEDEGSKMGTTLTMICLHKGGCLIGHIGDSRIYHIRPASNEIVSRTRDHSLVQQLFDIGEITEEEMHTSNKKNVILKAMQPKQQRRTMPELKNITDIKPGDYFYMCTDGMLEKMDDKEILSIIANETLSDKEKADILKNRTAGNADNHSAYLVHIEDVTKDIVPAPAAPAAPVESADADVSFADDDDMAAPTAAVVESTNSAAVVRPTTERTHKVVIPRKKNNNNSALMMIVVAVVIALACLATYWFLNKESKPEPQRIHQELPHKNGDDYLNEHSTRPSIRKVETTSGTTETPESRPSKPSAGNATNVVQPAQPAAQHGSSAGQQIQNAANSKPDPKRNATQAIRGANQNGNGYSLAPAGNLAQPSTPAHGDDDEDR